MEMLTCAYPGFPTRAPGLRCFRVIWDGSDPGFGLEMVAVRLGGNGEVAL